MFLGFNNYRVLLHKINFHWRISMPKNIFPLEVFDFGVYRYSIPYAQSSDCQGCLWSKRERVYQCIFVGYKFWSPEYAIKNTRKRKQQPLVDPPNLIDWKYILQYILGSHNINLTTKLVAFTDFEKIVKFRYLLKG